MKTLAQIRTLPIQLSLYAVLAIAAGCATDDKTSSSTSANSSATPAQAGDSPASGEMRFKATDGRTVSIGTCRASDGGRAFKDPHMDKCWIADGFTFTGDDVIYIAPVTSVVKVHDDEVPIQQIAEDNLVKELKEQLAEKGIIPRVVTDESAARGRKVLKLTETIIEYSKGGGGARYFVGLYGGGQPRIKVEGVLTEGDKTVFTYTMFRTSHTGGAFTKDEDIQAREIHYLVTDLTDFMAAIEGKYTPVN
ncbi:MAG TPA: hypothetical protein VK731_07635 [Candidatus Cybelea sp.]|jgi:hypothetical protein|nr:hypothetical protein [Candidatus Cybelea sp.]